MRTTHDVFHLAIPVHDLDATQQFYVSMLGCKLARRYPDRITVDFFGDQLVCHLTEGMSAERPASLYPRPCTPALFSARSRSTRRSPPGSRA
jgi:extradiol dioxygenase family protein